MNLSIDTDVLRKYNLSLERFLIMLLAYFHVDYTHQTNELIKNEILYKDLFSDGNLCCSGNTRKLIACILIESSPLLAEAPVKEFETLALQLMLLYPTGNKPDTTYPWCGSLQEIAQKLRVLVVEHHFLFTEAEARQATRQYVESFHGDFTYMKLLKYFLLRTKGKGEISSDFMTIIENNRDEQQAKSLNDITQ